MIKLFEQWVSEESAQPEQRYRLKVEADGKTFEVEGTSEKGFSNDQVTAFKVANSSDSSIKNGAMIRISPKADKSGNFDIVVTNDATLPEQSNIYSGKVTRTEA